MRETDFAASVRAFEEAVLSQRQVSPEHYDDEYFTAGWRDEGNRYDLMTRRRMSATASPSAPSRR